MEAFTMKTGRLAMQFQCSLAAMILSLYPLRAVAQVGPPSRLTPGHQHGVSSQNSQASNLIKTVRQATARFKDVSVAESEGYALQFGCVSGPDSGAMGLHFVNGALVGRGELDATRPQIVIYEPTADGHLKLIGADFLLLADAWNASHSGPPELMGQLFHLFESPNRFGLPAFYTLHVWAWKDNPNGAFVNWHPNVSCQSFTAE
jgi:hypothetical protein